MNLKVLFKNLFFIIILLNFTQLAFAADDKLEIYSPKYFEEQDNIYDDIHYLKNEDLSFKFCSDDEITNTKFFINCGNEKIDLPVIEYDSKCSFSNYDLEDLKCSSFTLDVIYTSQSKEKKLSREFKKEKQSNLANLILSKDFNLLSPLDLSYYLIVLSDIRNLESNDVQDVYDLLKNKRDNSLKCWPSSSCSLSQTVDILRNIKFAGFEKESRILEDGKFYLENNVVERAEGTYESSDNDDSYEYELKFINDFDDSGDIECEITTDDDDKNYPFDDNDDREDLMISKSVDEEIKLDCDKNVDEIQLRIYEEKIEEEDYSNDDTVDFELDDSDKNKYDSFDFVLEFEHSFGSNEEIDCEIKIDGDKKYEDNFPLDEDSDDELIIEDQFDDKIEIDCDGDDVDKIYLDIYADLDNQETYTNEDKFTYEVSSSSDKNKFEFRFDMEYDFGNDEEIECKLKIDDGSEKTYTFDEDDGDSFKIDGKSMAEKVSLDCDKELEKLRFRLYDSFGRAQIDEEKEDIKSHSSTVPTDFGEYSCIGSSKTCDYSSSIQSLYVYESDLDEASDIENYVDSLVQDHDNQGTFVKDKDEILDTSKYLTHKDDEDLNDFIKYVQNNEGSWGSGSDKIISSSWAVIGLENTDSNSEHLEDGKDWIYYNEPTNGWGSVEKNGLAYYAIKEKLKPYLILNAENTIYDQTVFTIENPTIYDLQELKVKFSKEIEDSVSGKVDLGNLESGEKISFNLTVSSSLLGNQGGEMTIEGVNHKKETLELIKIPIRVIGQMPFSIEKEVHSISDNELKIGLSLGSNTDSFDLTCEYTNPFTNAKESVKVNPGVKKIEILNAAMKTGNFSVDLSCKSDKDNFVINVPIEVIKVDKTFAIENKDITLTTDKDFSLKVSNLKADRQTLEISVEGVYAGVIEPAESGKILAKDESRDIFFKIVNPTFLSALGNNSEGYLVLKGDNGYVEKIPLNVDLGASNEGDSSMMVWYVAIGVIVLIVIIILLIRRYKQLNESAEPVQQQGEFHDDMMIDDLEFE